MDIDGIQKLLRRIDETMAEIEALTDTFSEGNYEQKLGQVIEMARSSRWQDGKLLTGFLYKDDYTKGDEKP